MANAIEVLLRMKDTTAPVVNNFKTRLQGLKSTVGGLTGLIAGLGSAVALGAIVRNINEAAAATAKLDAAFASTGKSSDLTRKQLDDLATSIQATTTFSDDLVKTAESVLLSFDKVRGQAFERTIKVAADLSARLGGDLTDAVRSVGFALQSPVEGLARLRRSGVQFDDSQKDLIKTLVESGRVTEAQSIILGELERKFGGAAKAARDTLGGALEGLKNAFGDLFEGDSKTGSGAAASINKLSEALSNPQFKKLFDDIIGGLASIAGAAVTATTKLLEFFSVPDVVSKRGIEAKLADVESEIKQRSRKDRGGNAIEDSSDPALFIRGVPQNLAAYIQERERLLVKLEDLNKKTAEAVAGGGDGGGITIDAIPLVDTFELMREASANFTEQLQADGEALLAHRDAIQEAFDSAPIIQWQADVADAESQLAPMLEAANEDIKRSSDEIGKVLDDQAKDAAEAMKAFADISRGAFEDLGRTIKSTLSDAFYDGKVSGDEFFNSVRRILADTAAAIVTSGISEALASAFGGSSGNSGIFASLFGAVIGGNAAGGRGKGMRWVGEEGRELVDMGGGSNVYNARQIAFAAGGGGGGLTYAPVNTFNIQGGGDSREMEARILSTVQYMNAKDRAEFERKLERNGYEVR